MILYAYQIHGELNLSREELVKRGFPACHLTDRSGAGALRCACSEMDPRGGWQLKGSASKGFWLCDPLGKQAALFEFDDPYAPPVLNWIDAWWNEYMVNQGWHRLNLTPQQVGDRMREVTAPIQNLIRERVQFHLDHLDKRSIRHSIDRWLQEAGAKSEICPGLWSIPDSGSLLLTAARGVLPEAEWKQWSVL